MPTQKKIETVQKLTDKLVKTKSVVLLNYQGLTHAKMEELRRAVKKVGGDFVVVKNTLFKLAAGQSHRKTLEGLTNQLSGATALLLSFEDDFLPLKEVAGFIKKFQLPTLKIGVLEDRTFSDKELISVAALPNKEVLLGQLAWQISSPLVRLTSALNWNLQKLVLTLKAIEQTKQTSQPKEVN